jgi:hypothetical protein
LTPSPNVLANDTDADIDDILTVNSIITFPSNSSTFNLAPDGTLTYTHDGLETTDDTIVYEVCDDEVPAQCDTATIDIDVTPVNDDPTAVSDSANVLEDSINNPIDVLDNDSDPEGDSLTITAASAGEGTVNIVDGGTLLRYSPDANYNGPDTISYTVTDSNGGFDSSSVSVTVTPGNDPPTANPDSATVTEDSSNNSIDVLNNDDDPDGDSLGVTAASAANGSVTIQGNNNLRYTPNADFNGQDTISYTISDGNGGGDSSTVTVTVTPQPDAPVAVDDTAAVLEDSQNNVINVTVNDTDADGDTLTVTTASAQNGSASGSNGTVIYTPTPDFNGQDTISYTITDGTGRNDSASVTVTVSNQNDPPTANDDTASVSEDSSDNVINVTVNDTDPDGDNLSVSAASASSGTATPGGANVVYTPQAEFSGAVTINYTVSDGNGGSDSAVVNVTVTSENDVPVAVNDTATVLEDSTGNVIDVTANDTDNDGDPLTVTQATALNGTAAPNGGNVTYTPNPDFAGQDTISYTISDGNGGTAGAVVTVTVTNENDPPVAVDDTATVEEDSQNNPINVTANDTDADNDTLTVSSASANNGTATPSGGTVVYTPNEDYFGPDTISYTISDGNGGSASASVSVTVNNVIDPPVARDDGPANVDEGGTISGTLNVLDNDDNPESDPMTAVLVSGPANARSFTLNADGTFAYTHDGSETTSDSFTYVADNGERSNTVTVSITVTPVNDAPRFSAVIPPGLNVAEDTTLTILITDLQITDPDNTFPDDFTLTLDPVVLPEDNYTLAGPASVTPAENFNGEINVRATVNDGQADSAPFLIPVTVDPVNDLPSLVEAIGSQNAVEDSPFTLDVSGNFTDADGDVLTYAVEFEPALPPERAISFDTATGQFSGAPDFEDDDPEDPVYQVTITASDPEAEFVTDTFDLTISQLGRANLGLEIEVTPETAFPNDQLRWTFNTNNPIGPSPGENVELSGSFIGDGLAVSVESGANCTINTQQGRVDFDCTVGALPIGETVPVVLSTTTTEVTEVVAFATSEGALRLPIDPNLANNSAVRAVGVAQSFSGGAVQLLGAAGARSVAAGDVNGDGTIDLVVGTESGQPVQIYLGAELRESCNCQRDFEASPLSIPDTGPNEGVALGDVDNNGSLDLIIANNGGQPDTVYLNDGAGNFTLQATLEPSNGRAVAVADFDNDGNLDIAIAAASPNLVYFGDGNGGFGASVLLGDFSSNDVAAGRFDGNDRVDLVFANVDSESRVYTKNQDAGFTESALFAIGDVTSVAAGDLNDDGLDDIVFGRVLTGGDQMPANPVFINQGGAVFGDPVAELGLSPTRDVLIGDVSDDGSPDLVFVNDSGVHQIWTAVGGDFELHAEQIIDIGAAVGVLAELGFADEGDAGGVDLALGGARGAGVGVYLNDSTGNLGLGDAVAPTLSLLGEAVVEIESGSAYVDAGAAAQDNIDGNISADILVDNPVNSAIVGSYTVTYNVSDLAGNAADPISRTVTVTPATGAGGGGGGALAFRTLMFLAWLAAAAAWRRQERLRRRLATLRNKRMLR